MKTVNEAKEEEELATNSHKKTRKSFKVIS